MTERRADAALILARHLYGSLTESRGRPLPRFVGVCGADYVFAAAGARYRVDLVLGSVKAESTPRPVDPDNTDPPPACASQCRYRQRFTGYARQRNALRSELAHMVSEWRCGWNLMPGRLGGQPLDYAPCWFVK